jgi:hypothetical protein
MRVKECAARDVKHSREFTIRASPRTLIIHLNDVPDFVRP